VLLVGETGCGKTTLCAILAAAMNPDKPMVTVSCHANTEAADFIGRLRPAPADTVIATKRMFEWQHGPLVNSMTDGAYFMLDEISLASDSVLERLNPVLEPERTLPITDALAGRVGERVVRANDTFRFLATMNPGGDYGKKEVGSAMSVYHTQITVVACIAQSTH
jgi:midasin